MRKKNIFGDNLRRLRLESDYTQEELAFKSGLSQGYVNQLESGKRRFSQKSLEDIAEALSVPAFVMLREGNEPTPKDKKSAITAKKKRPGKKEFLALLNDLPDHVVEHYLTLLTLERNILKKGKSSN